MFRFSFEHDHRNNNYIAYDITLTLSLTYVLRSTLKTTGNDKLCVGELLKASIDIKAGDQFTSSSIIV